MAKSYKMYLGGEWLNSSHKLKVFNPYDNKQIGTVAAATADDYTNAIAAAERAFTETKRLPSHVRSAVCQQISDGLRAKHKQFTTMMAMELGKAWNDCAVEVDRGIETFQVAAEEAKRIGGEMLDLDWTPRGDDRIGLIRRVPVGVISGITPYNFPLNLVAHKIAPAIASGNTIVIKPASKTPLIALMLAELIDKTDLPKGAVSVLPGSSKEAYPLMEDPRVKVVSFTGSDVVGFKIQEMAPRKKVVLELGGNASVIVADDADLDYASTQVVRGAYGSAGQSCISVQRIFVHTKVLNKFVPMLKKKTEALKVGDPMDEKTDVGTLVDEESLAKACAIVDEAVDGGGKILTGYKKKGLQLSPTLVSGAKPKMDIHQVEAFAPIAVVEKYTSFTQVVKQINNSRFGLQAGLFTNRMDDIMHAFRELEQGGIIVNDVPTFRADHMPYGGVKDSGVGREGIRWAIEDMTEVKLLALRTRTGA